MKNIISIILGILMFLKLMELLYGAIFLDKPLNPITKNYFYTDSHLYFLCISKRIDYIFEVKV